MKKLMLTAMLLLAIVYIYPQEIVIDYYDGEVEIMEKGKWVLPDMGEILRNDFQLKIGVDSYAEIKSGNSIIKLMKEGIYKADSLMSSLKQTENWEIGRIGSLNFKNIINKSAYNSSAAMGVRGEIQESKEIEWLDSGRDYLADGIAVLDEGNIAEALRIFNEGIELGEQDDNEPLYYYSALCHNLLGKNRESFLKLEMIENPENHEFYADYVILKGSILLEGLEYKKAEILFKNYILKDNSSEKAQYIYLLLSYCTAGLQSRDESKQYLSKAISLDSNNEIGKIAKQMMNTF